MRTIPRPRPRTRIELLLEGRHRWGWYERSSDLFAARTGIAERRLVVYAPGTDAAQRRVLVLARHWPAAGGMLALLVALVLVPMAPVAALCAMLALYAGGWLATLALSRRPRRACRSVRCATLLVGASREVLGDPDRLDRALAALLLLERRRASGLIDEVEFELGWWRVYDALA